MTGPLPAPSQPAFKLSSPGHALTDPSPIPVTLSVGDASLFDSLLGLRIAWKAVRLDTGVEVVNTDSALTTSSIKLEIDRWTDAGLSIPVSTMWWTVIILMSPGLMRPFCITRPDRRRSRAIR
ncbi:MAG TPA: hypothetical protein VK789_33835 [Bryobacteraceae bacterium]|nr:hypothetical protein [Bryobacteraceae bacterium]